MLGDALAQVFTAKEFGGWPGSCGGLSIVIGVATQERPEVRSRRTCSTHPPSPARSLTAADLQQRYTEWYANGKTYFVEDSEGDELRDVGFREVLSLPLMVDESRVVMNAAEAIAIRHGDAVHATINARRESELNKTAVQLTSGARHSVSVWQPIELRKRRIRDTCVRCPQGSDRCCTCT